MQIIFLIHLVQAHLVYFNLYATQLAKFTAKITIHVFVNHHQDILLTLLGQQNVFSMKHVHHHHKFIIPITIRAVVKLVLDTFSIH